MGTSVTSFRERRSPIAVAYSTKDRVDLTRATAGRLLAEDRIDLVWFDGSATPEGRALPGELMPGHAAATALHHGVVGGPDSAILYALLTLREAGYRWIVLIENDILLDEGWFDALFAAVAAAERDGFRVGGASCRVIANRVLSANGDYALLFNAGAGFLALTHEAAGLVIENYRTVDSLELARLFLNLTGLTVDCWSNPDATGPSRLLLSADWMFDAALYMHGLVVACPPATVARNIDPGDRTIVVEGVEDHRPGVRGALAQASQLRRMTRPDVRFQRSASSGLPIVGCHHLRLGGLGADPGALLSLTGDWKRRWLQHYGPFELFGSGSLTIALLDAPLMLLVHARDGAAVLELTGSSGATQVVTVDPPADPLPIAEIGLDPFGQRRGAVTVRVTSGTIGWIGLCMEHELIPYYAKAQPDFDFLAL